MTRTETPWGPWEPAALADVATLFSSVEVPWWVAGGYAIELAVGYSFRDHSDIDVLLLRRDQWVVQQLLPAWEWWAADPPGTLRPWQPGEILSAAVHDIWCRPRPSGPWRIQVMLDEAEGQDWISRRCAQVRRPIDLLGRCSRSRGWSLALALLYITHRLLPAPAGMIPRRARGPQRRQLLRAPAGMVADMLNRMRHL